jgi:hypothetical protein
MFIDLVIGLLSGVLRGFLLFLYDTESFWHFRFERDVDIIQISGVLFG